VFEHEFDRTPPRDTKVELRSEMGETVVDTLLPYSNLDKL
jgi:hypothetical protein